MKKAKKEKRKKKLEKIIKKQDNKVTVNPFKLRFSQSIVFVN